MAQPDSARVHVLLADAYREKKSLWQAEAEYQKAIQLRPDLLAAHLGLARAYWEASEDDKAVPEITKVLDLNPRDPEGAYMMGEILVTRHQYAAAIPFLSLALEGADSTLPRVHALRAKVFAAQGQTTEAVAELKLALDADRDGSYHYQLYQLYKKLGDTSAAADALQKSESLRKASDRKNATSTP
jgi:tetratricopeptide (TPR) repeat protein